MFGSVGAGQAHRPVASLYLLLRRACSMSDEKGACVRLACASSATIKNCRLTRRFVCRAADDLDQMGLDARQGARCRPFRKGEVGDKEN